MNLDQLKFCEDQVSQYKTLQPLYEAFSKILKKILTNLVNGCSSEFIIQRRVKTVSSFANKIYIPEQRYVNPLSEINDLCGIRVILPNLNELNAVCELIRDNFIVNVIEDENLYEKSEVVTSVHHYQTYIIQLLPDLSLYERLKTNDIQFLDGSYAINTPYVINIEKDNSYVFLLKQLTYVNIVMIACNQTLA